ncbi:MAG: polyamine ABC transporter substrate-binding protein [Salinarimonas sp.]|nr:polyamine ABC transporter substrate-binding protein [Salinarimonas sp.]
MLRSILTSTAACAVLAMPLAIAASHSANAQSDVVNVYNWSDYIDPATLEAFTEETGIRVVYDTYDTNEIVETRLLAGRSGYDIVVPTGPYIERLIQAGVLAELDKEQLPNLDNVWPEIAERTAIYDPGNAHSVIYMWGTTGIGVNVDMVRERLGEDAPLDTWSLVFDPDIAAQLSDCGIYIVDAADDMFPSALNYLGLPHDSRDPGEIEQAAELLSQMSTHVRRFHASEYINAIANGDICVAVGYSGDILQARDRAEEAGSGIDIAYFVPREGAVMWFDSFAIPADAPNPENAHAFIDYMLRADVAADNVNYVAYASGVLPAKPMIDDAILNDPGIYPDDETMDRLLITTAYDERTQRLITRSWTRIQTGR